MLSRAVINQNLVSVGMPAYQLPGIGAHHHGDEGRGEALAKRREDRSGEHDITDPVGPDHKNPCRRQTGGFLPRQGQSLSSTVSISSLETAPSRRTRTGSLVTSTTVEGVVERVSEPSMIKSS